MARKSKIKDIKAQDELNHNLRKLYKRRWAKLKDYGNRTKNVRIDWNFNQHAKEHHMLRLVIDPTKTYDGGRIELVLDKEQLQYYLRNV